MPEKNSGSYPLLLSALKSAHAHTETQMQTRTLSRVSLPPPSPSSLLHIHARKHTQPASLYTRPHSIACETDSIDAELPVPAGSVPLKHGMHLPKLG